MKKNNDRLEKKYPNLCREKEEREKKTQVLTTKSSQLQGEKDYSDGSNVFIIDIFLLN